MSEIEPNATATKIITVSKADLPLHCPMPNAELWNMHPKVFLPIEATKQATCPYCGAKYKLED